MPRDDVLDCLSARETEVARLYISGLSYKEIARDLEIAPGTVRTHLNSIYRKLNVANRIELLGRFSHRQAAVVEPAPPRVDRSPDDPIADSLSAPPVPERRQLTVLFADLAGSTALGATLDAEDMHTLLNEYRTTVRQQIERLGGHAAGFPGDGVVACFGWPKAMEDAAERAVSAGLLIKDAVARLQSPDGSPLRARVGIATGMVVIDAVSGRADSLTGSTPNLAARLQAVADPGQVAIAATTRELVGDQFETVALGAQAIKGLPDPVPVFRVVGERQDVSRFEARHTASILPMVGRDEELALLTDRWARACKGEGQAVLLAGEPGIGKSRLAAALIEAARADGAVILRYQTASQQTDSPLWPVRQQLAAAAGLMDGQSADDQLQRLESLLALAVPDPGNVLILLADLLDIPVAEPLPSMSAERRRERLLEALTDQLLGLARQGPVLALFEDLHWIDPTTLELINRILACIVDERSLILLTSRHEGDAALAGHPHLTRVTLSRLPKAAALAIVGNRAGGIDLDAEIVQTILARTDGVPLYIEEMTAAILESDAGIESVPASLQDSLMARLDRLGEAKATAQVAAVIGREFDDELLTALSDSPAAYDAAIDALLRAELVFRRGRRYSFKHALVHDVAYQSLLRSQRLRLHGRIAEMLLGRFPSRVAGQPELLAHHLDRAGRTPAAIDYYVRAADIASYRGANREAHRHLKRALSLILTLPSGKQRDRREVAALTALGRITVALEGHASDRTAKAYQRALKRCRAADLGMAEFAIVLGLTIQAAVSGDEHAALDLAHRLRSLADSVDDPIYDVQASYALGITHCWRGERADALRHFEAGMRAYAPEQHARHVALYSQDPGVVCGTRGAVIKWHMGDVDGAARQLDTVNALARQLGHPFSLNYALNWRALHALEAADPETAERAVFDTLSQAEEQGFAIWKTMGLIWRGRWVLENQSPHEAVRALDRALESIRSTGSGCCTGYALGLLADALRQVGRAREGLDRADEAVALIRKGATGWAEVEVLRAMARCLLATGGGSDQRAAATLECALAVAQRQSSRILELRAAMDLAGILAERSERRRAYDLLSPRVGAFESHRPGSIRELDQAQQLLRSVA